MFDTFDHFNAKQNSKIWPSDDPEDSPTCTYTCKHCGESTELQSCGTLPIGKSFDEMARVVLRDHLGLCPKFNVTYI